MKTKLLSVIVIALSATAAAHAGNVSWGVSIGGYGPAISVGVAAGHHGHYDHYRHYRHHGFQVAVPVVVTRAPAVVYAPPQVVMAAPVCAPAPVYVAARGPVFVAPPPVCAPRFGFRAHW